jgi:hypothetical protein
MFAVAGIQTNLPDSDKNILHLISAYGKVFREYKKRNINKQSTYFKRLQSVRVPAGLYAGIG